MSRSESALDLRDLRVPVIQAPMAGGPTTPALAAAVGNAGGLGFLAAGYLQAEAVGRQIAELRGLLGPGAAFGVNVFVPQPVAEPDAVAGYRATLEAAEGGRLGVSLPEPDFADTDAWAEKISILIDDPVPAVSFTFGLPGPDVIARLRSQGTYVIGTVTSPAEAQAAAAAGVHALCVQGPEAGGHRGTFDPAAEPSAAPLDELLAAVAAVTDLPFVAAGGLGTGADVARVLAAGAVAAQLGTAFLRADEAGTAPLYRAALADHERFDSTVLTRAFSGRWARALRNGFTQAHPDAPAAYPAINQLTRPLRAEARRGDADGISLYAGIGHRAAGEGEAADLLARIAPR